MTRPIGDGSILFSTKKLMMEESLAMEARIIEIAQRISGLREILELSQEEMAAKVNVSLETYQSYESGESDFGFTFLYECAKVFGVDIVELLTG